MNALVRHVLVIVCLSPALLAPTASGHVVDSVELELRHDPGQWELTGLLDITFMLPETRGDPNELPLDRLDVMAEPPEVLEEMRRQTEATLRRILAFTFDHEPLPWRLEGVSGVRFGPGDPARRTRRLGVLHRSDPHRPRKNTGGAAGGLDGRGGHRIDHRG